MAMRILIDLQGAQNASRYRGIGRYSLALAKGIARNAAGHQVFILLNGLFSETIDEIKASFSGILSASRFIIFSSPGPVSAVRSENIWRRCTAEILREHLIDSIAPDALLITSMIEGREDDTVTSLGNLKSTIPTAAILYDLIPMADPEQYIASDIEKAWYYSKIGALRRADYLFAISQCTANEGVSMLDIESTRVRNISAAADNSFSSMYESATDAVPVMKRLGIDRKYLMHSSVFSTRKNFQGLVRAYAALPPTVRADHQLVLVCKIDAAGRGELTTLAKSLGLAPDDMVLPGFVSDGDLIALYTRCHLFVFPSFQEGFGLPALEAMCCGIPTIGSNATSVPEVIGRADALFDPTSVKDMTALILKALTDASFYQSLKAHTKTQSAKFSWDESARRAIAGMEELVTRAKSSTQGVESTSTKRKKMLEAVAKIACHTSPTDFEILALASSIEANRNEVIRLEGSAAEADS
jgi:glycosyltransferase involved in cell wall biosynthesis